MKEEKPSFMTKLSVLFAQRSRLSILFLAATLAVGALSYTVFLKREGFPPIDVPVGVVSTPYFVQDKQLVDSEVTKPIETAVSQIDEVKSVTSTSSDNFSVVQVEFNEGTTSKSGMEKVRDKVSQISTLPQNIEPNFIEFDAAKFDGQYDLVFSLKSEGKSIREIQAKAIEIAEIMQESPSISEAIPLEVITNEVNPITGEKIENISGYNRVGVNKDGSLIFSQAISIGVIKENANEGSIDFSNSVKKELDLIKEDGQLEGYETVFSFGDQSISLISQIDSLEENTVAALFIILGVLFFFINWRASIVTVIFIPTVLAATFIVFFLIGYSLNVLSLFGLILVLGLFVDDATVVVEAIDYQKKHGAKGMQAIIRAVNRVGIADISGTLTTLLVFVPMALISGVLGSFIRIIPITVIIALGLSLIYSLTVIPFLSNIILTEARSKVIRAVSSFLFVIIFAAFAFSPMVSVLVGVAILVVGLIVYGLSKILNKKTDYLTIIDTILNESNLLVIKLGEKHGKFVKLYLTYPYNLIIGLPMFIVSLLLIVGAMFSSQFVKFDIFPAPKDTTDFVITIAYEPQTTVAQAEEIAKTIESKHLSNYSEYIKNVDYFGANENKADIYISLTALDEREITSTTIVDELNNKFAEIEGASIKAAKLSAGPPTSDFPYQMQIFSDNQQILESSTKSIDAYIRSIELESGIKVSEVKVDNLDDISKIDGRRYVTIRAKFDKKDFTTGDVIALRDNIKNHYSDEELKKIGLNDDAIGFDLGQESENLESFNSALFALLAALVMMYLLLVLQFDSFTQPFLVFMAIPFSFPGLIGGLYFSSNPFSFFAMIGIIGLTGIVVNNTIMLLDFAKQYREEGHSISEAISEAIKQRLRPLLTTSATTVLGLFPLAMSDPFWESLAFSIIFGLLSSTLTVIIIFPYYYYLLEQSKKLIASLVRYIKSMSDKVMVNIP